MEMLTRIDSYVPQAGIITLKCDIIKGGVEKFALKQPIFVPGPVSCRWTGCVKLDSEQEIPSDGPDVFPEAGL